MKIKPITQYGIDDFESFKCGNIELDNYLKKYALKNDLSGYGKTFLLEENDEIKGFFTLCSSSIKFDEYIHEENIYLPKYPIPCVRIARLAVQKKDQGKGYGKQLLKQALLKIILASSTIGIRLIVVDAKETSVSFYEKYGFQKLLNNKLTYCLLIDTLKEAIK